DGFPGWAVAVGDHVAVLSTIGWLFGTETERDEWAGGPPVSDTVAEVSQTAGGRPATEPARRLAAELGIALEDVPGTGIVRAGDVRALAAAAGPTPVSDTVTEPSRGRLSDELRERLKTDAAAIAALPPDEKVALYREHGAEIGDRVTIAAGALIDAQ